MTTPTPNPKPMPKPPTPYRQIRALYDADTITLYQAYSAPIATAAVATQNLAASPDYSFSRMTWVKPSWNWMMYRSGYSYKDSRQAHILALSMKHADFIELLETAVLAHEPRPKEIEEEGKAKGEEEEEEERLERRKKNERVVVQWDPERSVRIGRLEYRSIQIGIPRALVEGWVKEGIVSIEDVTERARELKRAVEEDKEVTVEELVERGLVPEERIYEVPGHLREILGMDEK